MKIELMSMVGGTPKTPRWLRDQPVAILKRGTEGWWVATDIIVRGAAPPKTTIIDEVFVRPAGWGPTGLPVQVIQSFVNADDVIAMQTKDGATLTHMGGRVHRFLYRYFRVALHYFVYPEADQFRELIVGFTRTPDPLRPATERGGFAAPLGFAPVVFVNPLIRRANLFLDPQEVDMLPVMEGYGPLDADENHPEWAGENPLW